MCQGGFKDNKARQDELTDEERLVLELVVAGHSTEQIADALGSDTDTVCRRLQTTLRKLLGQRVLH